MLAIDDGLGLAGQYGRCDTNVHGTGSVDIRKVRHQKNPRVHGYFFLFQRGRISRGDARGGNVDALLVVGAGALVAVVVGGRPAVRRGDGARRRAAREADVDRRPAVDARWSTRWTAARLDRLRRLTDEDLTVVVSKSDRHRRRLYRALVWHNNNQRSKIKFQRFFLFQISPKRFAEVFFSNGHVKKSLATSGIWSRLYG